MKVINISLIVICISIQGCSFFRSVEGPMSLIDDYFKCDIRPKTLLVLLPGAYDTPQDFIDQNFVKEVRQRNIYADIRIVDAHIGYYKQRQIVKRLEDEIIAPAKAKGYQKIWFAGISLGGYGSLMYSMDNPSVLDGVFLMAPYLGVNQWPIDIQNQGGLKNWPSIDKNKNKNDVDVNLWRWLKSYISEPTDKPKTYLGFGSNDRFAQSNGVLVEVLPKENSMIIPGGHDWKTWHKLWTKFLDTAPLQRLDLTTSNCKTP
jgi:Putative esterase